MATWDKGWLPQGWRRGDALEVINAGYVAGRMAALRNVEPPALWPQGGSGEHLPVIMQFDWAEQLRVANWLEWFCFADQYRALLRQIMT